VNGDVFFAAEIKAVWRSVCLSHGTSRALSEVSADLTRKPNSPESTPCCRVAMRSPEMAMFASICIGIGNLTAEQMGGDTRSEAEIVEEFRQALRDAVRQRLVADVEVASYLSGGIDSCAVLGLAQQEMERPIRAFTLTFEKPPYDEASIAEAQARHVGARYHPIPITGREIADSFADAIWHAKTQMFNGHGVAKNLLSRAVEAAAIKVMFTGEGADEMLGGYPYFRVDALNDNVALRCSTPIRRLARC
jgi:asparagine synthase (glutamine-hydrolysing)